MEKQFYSYFCYECKKDIPNLNQAYVLDDEYSAIFCSKECGSLFYAQSINHFIQMERDLRLKHKIREEAHIDRETMASSLKTTLDYFDEHFVEKSDLREDFHYLFKNFHLNGQKVCFIAIVKFFKDKPSFLFHYVISSQKVIIDCFKRGDKVQDVSEKLLDEQPIAPEIYEELDQMRSEYFAELIDNENDDIGFESYHLYEKYREETLDRADEIYEFVDEDKRKILVHVKAFENQEQSEPAFFYFVLHLLFERDNSQVRVPALSFPSKRQEVYLKYCKGLKIKEKRYN